MSPEINEHAVDQLYQFAIKRRAEQVSYVWETVKFTTSLCIAIITATLALWRYLQSRQVLFLPVFGLLICFWASYNVRRQYRRFLEILTMINKIERWMGLHREVEEDRRFYREERHLIPERYLESETYGTGEEFINATLSIRSSSMYGYIAKFFILLFALFLVLSIVIYWNPSGAAEAIQTIP